jgi:hypothetical protein
MPHDVMAREQGALPSRVSRCEQHASTTFAQARRLYLTAGGEDRFSEECKQLFADMHVAKITQAVIDHYAGVLYPHVEPPTLIREYYVPLAAILHFAASLGLCDYRQIRRPRLPKHLRLRWIWPAEFGTASRRMLAPLPSIVSLLATHGCQPGRGIIPAMGATRSCSRRCGISRCGRR